MQEKYDTYLDAINSTDFGKISALISSMDSSEANIIDSIKVNAEWDSPAKDALVNKTNEFNSKFRSFLTEKENLSNIILISEELKEYILKYKEATTQLGTLKNSMSSKKIELESFKANHTIPIPEYDSSSLTEYLSFIKLIDNVNNNILGKNTEISTLSQNADIRISQLKAIQFGSSAGVTFESTLGNVYGGRGGRLDGSVAVTTGDATINVGETQTSPSYNDAYKLSSHDLLTTPLSEYNNLFGNTYEANASKNSSILDDNLGLLRGQQLLTSGILADFNLRTQPNQVMAFDLANIADAKLSAQIELNNKAKTQQDNLYQKYRTTNDNKNIFNGGVTVDQQYRDLNIPTDSTNPRAVEIRAIKAELERTTDPKRIEDLTSKLKLEVEKFNSANVEGMIPMSSVLDPELTNEFSKTNPFVDPSIPSTVKETSVLTLFTESFCGLQRTNTTTTPINDSSGNVIGYQLTDSRFDSGPQTYSLYVNEAGYTMRIGDQEYQYPKTNNK